MDPNNFAKKYNFWKMLSVTLTSEPMTLKMCHINVTARVSENDLSPRCIFNYHQKCHLQQIPCHTLKYLTRSRTDWSVLAWQPSIKSLRGICQLKQTQQNAAANCSEQTDSRNITLYLHLADQSSTVSSRLSFLHCHMSLANSSNAHTHTHTCSDVQ